MGNNALLEPKMWDYIPSAPIPPNASSRTMPMSKYDMQRAATRMLIDGGAGLLYGGAAGVLTGLGAGPVAIPSALMSGNHFYQAQQNFSKAADGLRAQDRYNNEYQDMESRRRVPDEGAARRGVNQLLDFLTLGMGR